MPQTPREMTWAAVLLSLLLSVVMGAANVYLGLRVGMTVSASIPAAVMALAILNGLLRRESVLEANLVQTGASAGESLAAGVIFTLPALILIGVWKEFDFWITTAVAATGGVLGVLLMIPMRKAFIVDSPELPFPEGVACAEVLKTAAPRPADGSDHAGNKHATSPAAADHATAETGAALIFLGLAIGAAFKVGQSFFGLMKSSLEGAAIVGGRVFYFGAGAAPVLIAVGAIVGLPIAVQIFLGGAIAWLVAIPALFVVEPTAAPTDAAWELWSTQVRYLGVGAMLVGGVVSTWQVRGGLAAAGRELLAQFSRQTRAAAGPEDAAREAPSTGRNLSTHSILILTILTTLAIGTVYYTLLQAAGLTLLTTAVMFVMAFFFTAVASYIVGLVGNSNSPVSGMTITAVLGTGGLLYLFRSLGLLEMSESAAILATMGVAGVICCVACTAGDVCNDLKTGHLVGATPRNQQVMQLLGVLAGALVMAPVLTVLHEGSLAEGKGGIGGSELPAPQAVLFANLAKGMFAGAELPWTMIGAGVALGTGLAVADALLRFFRVPFRLYVMPVAVGMYLPFGVATPILVGGCLHYFLTRSRRGDERTSRRLTLAASGVIAGESLAGVALGLFAYLGYASWNVGAALGLAETSLTAITLLALAGVALWMILSARRKSTS